MAEGAAKSPIRCVARLRRAPARLGKRVFRGHGETRARRQAAGPAAMAGRHRDGRLRREHSRTAGPSASAEPDGHSFSYSASAPLSTLRRCLCAHARGVLFPPSVERPAHGTSQGRAAARCSGRRTDPLQLRLRALRRRGAEPLAVRGGCHCHVAAADGDRPDAAGSVAPFSHGRVLMMQQRCGAAHGGAANADAVIRRIASSWLQPPPRGAPGGEGRAAIRTPLSSAGRGCCRTRW